MSSCHRVIVSFEIKLHYPDLFASYFRSQSIAYFDYLGLSTNSGGVVAENAKLLFSTTASGGAGLLPLIVSSVLGLHTMGFIAGYLVPRKFLKFGERTSRTISIETGMQNSALAVVLARSIGASSIASLPGALSATAHSCMGSILAAYWRGADKRGDDKVEV